MSEREKFEDAERRKFEAVARAICTASGSLPNQQMPLGGSMWMFYEDEARAAIQAVKPFYGPVIVHPDSSPDEMNLLYGEAYGVDWEYPPKAPRADQAAEIAALRTELEEARKDAERWQYWRDVYEVNLVCTIFGNGCINKRVEQAEAVIDAAIDAAKE